MTNLIKKDLALILNDGYPMIGIITRKCIKNERGSCIEEWIYFDDFYEKPYMLCGLRYSPDNDFSPDPLPIKVYRKKGSGNSYIDKEEGTTGVILDDFYNEDDKLVCHGVLMGDEKKYYLPDMI